MFKIIPINKGYQIEINGKRLDDIFERRDWAVKRLELIKVLFYDKRNATNHRE